MKNQEKYSLLILLALVIVVFGIGLHSRFPYPQIIPGSFILAIITLAVGIRVISSKKKENFETPCQQIININPMYGERPSPMPSPAEIKMISPSDADKWISSVDKDFSENCKGCLSKNLAKVWTVDMLEKVKKMSPSIQLDLLKLLVMLDCDKECEPKPIPKPVSKLTKDKVEALIKKIYPDILETVKECMENNIMKLWDEKNFDIVLSKPLVEQEKILNGILALNCGNIYKMYDKKARDLFASVGGNINTKCGMCILQSIIKNWDMETFSKVEKMNLPQRKLFIDTYSKLCDAECKIIISKVLPSLEQIEKDIMMMEPLLKEECAKCVASHIHTAWNYDSYEELLMLKDKMKQKKIIQNLLSICNTSCGNKVRPSPPRPVPPRPVPPKALTKEDVTKFVQSIEKDVPIGCLDCISTSVFENKSGHTFADLKKMTPVDASKALHQVSEHLCPNVCKLPPHDLVKPVHKEGYYQSDVDTSDFQKDSVINLLLNSLYPNDIGMRDCMTKVAKTQTFNTLGSLLTMDSIQARISLENIAKQMGSCSF